MNIVPVQRILAGFEKVGLQVNYPTTISAPRFIVPSASWLETTLSMHWPEFKSDIGMAEYVPGSGMCDEFAAAATVFCNIAARKALVDIDARAAVWDFRFGIRRGSNINGVTDGYHAANLIAHEGRRGRIELSIWEPQSNSWQLNHTPIAAAATRIFSPALWL